jgi:TetR/AcrR family transcriptional repressor of nem operon
MPHAKDRKARTRQRIVRSAQRLFTAHGFEATTIEQIMRASQLTRGGFYAHFRSKAQLYAEAVGHAASADPTQAPAGAPMQWIDALFEACALPPQARAAGHDAWQLLATDAASDNPEVRAGYGRMFRRLTQQLQRDRGRAFGVDGDALATAALVIGTLAVASSIDDRWLRLRVIDACRERARLLLCNRAEAPAHEFLWAVDASHARAAAAHPMH